MSAQTQRDIERAETIGAAVMSIRVKELAALLKIATAAKTLIEAWDADDTTPVDSEIEACRGPLAEWEAL